MTGDEIQKSMEYVEDFYTCMDEEGLDREGNARHFRNVHGQAYLKLNGYSVHNTEVLLFIMGFQGGTVHQVAEYLNTTTQDILSADHSRMQDLMRMAQKRHGQHDLKPKKLIEAIHGAGVHDFSDSDAHNS